MPLHSHFSLSLLKKRKNQPSEPSEPSETEQRWGFPVARPAVLSRPRPSEGFRICAAGHKGQRQHQTQDVKQGRLPNGHATPLPTGETIAIQRKVECRRSTTSPWAPWQRQDRVVDRPQWRVSGANISDQRPSLSLGRSTKAHLREDCYRTIFSPMRPI
jgi:hypothetical protein